MSNLFWLSDEQLAAIEAAVIRGIIHVLKIGCRWEDCPSDYGPHTTIYNRFNRWSKAGIWSGILANLVGFDATDIQCIDSTTAKAHRCAAGGKQEQAIGRSRRGRTTKIHAAVDGDGRIVAFELTGGNRHDIKPAAELIEPLPPAKSLLGDAAYDSDAFHAFLTGRGTTPVIKQNPTRKHFQPFDKAAYRGRNIIERAFSHLKDWRRVATRYDQLARNFCTAVVWASILRWWT